MKAQIGLILLFALFGPASFAGQTEQPGLDTASQKALQETQQLLTDPKIRDQEIKKDQGAIKWDGNVNEITGGGQKKEEMYQISSDIMSDLTKKTNGDPVKMLEIMEKAKTNPEAFFNSLTPEEQAKIRGLSQRLPAAQQQQQPVAPK